MVEWYYLFLTRSRENLEWWWWKAVSSFWTQNPIYYDLFLWSNMFKIQHQGEKLH
jgi:hypothetical protein